MAAGTEPMNGTDIILSISEDTGTTFDIIGRATVVNLTTGVEEIDTTTKQSAGNKEIIAGKFSWSMTVEALVTYDAETDTDKPNDLYNLQVAKTKIDVKFGSVNPGEFDHQGSCFITEYSQSAGTEETATYSATFTGTGALTQTVVPV